MDIRPICQLDPYFIDQWICKEGNLMELEYQIDFLIQVISKDEVISFFNHKYDYILQQ